MLCLLEGKNELPERPNIRYPNKIGSFGSKKILGDYLRDRMGIEHGKFITKEDFKKYGRDNIEISLISPGVYYFDFST